MVYQLSPKEFRVILDVFAEHVKTLTDDQRLAMTFDPMDIVNDLRDEHIVSVSIHIKDVA